MAENKRPNPQHLLQQASGEEQQNQRGCLRIYLGAAPGVGKTYAMLEDAWQQSSKGLDVVVGVVEAHGRVAISELLKKFELLAPQKLSYHGRQLAEFDLAGALQRDPAILLVDELAHTNVEGAKNSKRWQDIVEILNNGIDVYTTVNVQHLESVVEAVYQITGIRVQETVPDSVFEFARTIKVIDLPFEDLQARLREGKIYIPQQAQLAEKNFFRQGNLIALRELTLRVAAEYIDAQVLLYRHGHGISEIWPTREKFLVCVGDGLEALKLIRTTKRLSQALHAEWLAVHVETPQLQALGARNLGRAHLKLAAQLGAETKLLRGAEVVKMIMQIARQENITQIVIGKKIRTWWKSWLRHDLADNIVRNSGEIDVYVITGS